MTLWTIPDWMERWGVASEILHLRALASLVEVRWPRIECRPDFSTEGCAFVEFHLDDVCTGRACVSVVGPALPHFSCYLGAHEDEFHGYNIDAAAAVIGHYSDALPDE